MDEAFVSLLAGVGAYILGFKVRVVPQTGRSSAKVWKPAITTSYTLLAN